MKNANDKDGKFNRAPQLAALRQRLKDCYKSAVLAKSPVGKEIESYREKLGNTHE